MKNKDKKLEQHKTELEKLIQQEVTVRNHLETRQANHTVFKVVLLLEYKEENVVCILRSSF